MGIGSYTWIIGGLLLNGPQNAHQRLDAIEQRRNPDSFCSIGLSAALGTGLGTREGVRLAEDRVK